MSCGPAWLASALTPMLRVWWKRATFVSATTSPAPPSPLNFAPHGNVTILSELGGRHTAGSTAQHADISSPPCSSWRCGGSQRLSGIAVLSAAFGKRLACARRSGLCCRIIWHNISINNNNNNRYIMPDNPHHCHKPSATFMARQACARRIVAV